MFSKNVTKIDEIFTVDLTLCSKCQIDGKDFVNFCGLLRKHELYHYSENEILLWRLLCDFDNLPNIIFNNPHFDI